MSRHHVTEDQARAFLLERVGEIEGLEALEGGFWSSAYGFRHGDRPLVVRFGAHREWYEADRRAMAYASPALPVPEVLEVGDAMGGAYTISERRVGRPLEDVLPTQRDAAGPLLAGVFGALFEASAEACPAGPVHPSIEGTTWRGWLRERLHDDPNPEVVGLREALAANDLAARTLARCEARVLELVAACPERRDLVHADLLHGNVLTTEDASRATAVFSWKCALRGDFLYDVACCTFWSPWHPGIAAAEPWRQAWRAPSIGDDPDAWRDASERHHCYELHVGATHLGWCAWLGDDAELERLAQRLVEVLERGPLAAPSRAGHRAGHRAGRRAWSEGSRR